jgi:hypothetical protein
MGNIGRQSCGGLIRLTHVRWITPIMMKPGQSWRGQSVAQLLTNSMSE